MVSLRKAFGLALAATTAVTAPLAAGADFVNVLTGGTSGVYYPLGSRSATSSARRCRP